jgi:hypothetical protein
MKFEYISEQQMHKFWVDGTYPKDQCCGYFMQGIHYVVIVFVSDLFYIEVSVTDRAEAEKFLTNKPAVLKSGMVIKCPIVIEMTRVVEPSVGDTWKHVKSRKLYEILEVDASFKNYDTNTWEKAIIYSADGEKYIRTAENFKEKFSFYKRGK